MSLARRMAEDGYDGYAYSYPHKTAYRPLDPALPLTRVWEAEDRGRLFLYVHLPFCEMRCGFCNLFTTVRPGQDLVQRTLEAISRQSSVVASAVAPVGIAQAAFGGGTPSFLSERQLEQLWAGLSRCWPVRWSDIPVSFELSPGTVTAEKLALLKALGVDRISLGVQSFVSEDLRSLGRPAEDAELACERIREAGFPVFNLDLIYGNEGQDRRRWLESLNRALRWQPEELYLYPLYVGQLTGLSRRGRRPGERRRELYRAARERLLEAGYLQVSMRLFRRPEVTRETDYCCQEDGMVGLGPGARSYTRALHYSTEYAVGQPGVRRIIEAFVSRRYDVADYGIALDEREQKLRYVIKTLLRVSGRVIADLPQLGELVELGLAVEDADGLRLTEEGLAWSDTIGPWLYSSWVQERMAGYQLA